MGYRRIDPDRRAAILAAIERRDGLSRAQLARDFDVSPRTVQRIADDADIESPWDTTGTRQATAAARDHLRARRAALSARFLEEADRLLNKMHGPFVVFAFGGRDNEFNSATLAEPPTTDLRNLMTSAAVAFDKHLAADKHDADAGEDDAVSMLGRLADGLAAAHRHLAGGDTPSELATDDAVQECD